MTKKKNLPLELLLKMVLFIPCMLLLVFSILLRELGKLLSAWPGIARGISKLILTMLMIGLIIVIRDPEIILDWHNYVAMVILASFFFLFAFLKRKGTPVSVYLQ